MTIQFDSALHGTAIYGLALYLHLRKLRYTVSFENGTVTTTAPVGAVESVLRAINCPIVPTIQKEDWEE